jgi:hypothetical protein
VDITRKHVCSGDKRDTRCALYMHMQFIIPSGIEYNSLLMICARFVVPVTIHFQNNSCLQQIVNNK